MGLINVFEPDIKRCLITDLELTDKSFQTEVNPMRDSFDYLYPINNKVVISITGYALPAYRAISVGSQEIIGKLKRRLQERLDQWNENEFTLDMQTLQELTPEWNWGPVNLK